MSASTVITTGFGTFGNANFVITEGYGDYGGGAGPVVVAFNGVSMAGSVTQHGGVSRPNIKDQDSTTKDYRQYDFKPDGVNRETYTVDGVIP